MRRRSIIFAVAAAPLMALPALAVDGTTPIPNAAIYATPIVINQPGSYVVTRNLTPTGPGPIIDIALGPIPGGVELDLNGFLLDNTPNPVNPVIQVSSAGAGQEVVIRNGSTMGGSNGILAPSPGLPPLPRRVVIEDVYVSDTTGDGIRLEDMKVYTVRRCQVRAAQGIGILVWDTGGIYAKQGLIADNHVRQTADGIVVMST